jgi:hypothetical protein
VAWLKVDDNAPHHKKMLAAGDVACWLWICGLAYCQRHMTDGLITPEAVPFLGCKGWKAAVSKLVASGLWVEEGTGYRVHDFLHWNDSAEVRRQKIRDGNERVTRFREARKREGNTVGNNTPTPLPLPQPTPLPTPSAAESAAVEAPPSAGPPMLPRGRPGLVQSPGAWGVKHAGHTDGVCGWKCMFPDQRAEFANGAGWSEADVSAWAQAVRADWERDGLTPTGKPYDFWNARWVERHGSSQAVPATSRAQLDPAAGVREALRRG